MSKTVDQRVVEMQFDNRHFENNVRTTMSTLDKLKQSLNLSGAVKGLGNINTAAKSCNLTPISNAVQTVQLKFSALQVAGVTAMANLANSAVNYGKKIVNSLTVEPITTGFNEYELKMGSIQTIMASTGENLQTVNKYLNELNEYSDKTIYSFSDMTQNIGKFTNAGVKLEDAVLAIKGISNEAAISGANANEASRAMYNFAQALSAGYVKLIDWKSIELANMATVDFKQQLIDAAVAAGTLTKSTDGYKTSAGTVITATKNFNDSLQDQWMTTEVLISTLRDYADESTDIGKKATAAAQDVKTFSMMMDTLKESAQSGWATTWEIIVGDYEEAKSLFTHLSKVFGDIISKTADARNQMLENALGNGSTGKWGEYIKKVNEAGVATEDFQDTLLEIAAKHDKSIGDMIKDGKEFEEVMKSGKITSGMIAETLEKFANSAGKASKSTADATDKLNKMKSVVNDVIKGNFGNGAERMKKLAEAGYEYAEVQELVNKVLAGGKIELSDLSEKQLESLGYTEEQISALKELAEEARKTGTPVEELIEDMGKLSGREMLVATLKNAFEELNKVLDVIKQAWEKVFPDSGKSMSDKLYEAIEALYKFIGTGDLASETLTNIGTTFEGLFRVLEITTFMSNGAYKAFKKILGILKTTLGLDFWGLTARVAEMVIEFRNWIFSNNELMTSLVNTGHAILDFVEDTVDAIKSWIAEFLTLPVVQDNLKAFCKSFVESMGKLKEWFLGFGDIFSEFAENMRNLESVSFENILGAIKNFGKNLLNHILDLPNAFTKIVEAAKNFAQSIANHFGNAGNAVTNTIGGIWEKIKSVYETIKTWISENISFGEVFAVLIGVGMIVSILKVASILNKAFVTIADLSGSVKGTFKALTGMFEGFKEAKMLEAKSVALRNLAISIAILAGSIFVLAQLDVGQLAKGVITIALVGGLLVGLAAILGKIGKLSLDFSAGSMSILALAGAVGIIALALKLMDTLNRDNLKQNVATIMLIMVELGVVMVIMSKLAPQLSGGSFALISFAASIGILVYALNSIGDLKISNILESLGLLVGVILAMALVSKMCGSMSIGTMFGVIGVALALKLFVNTITEITAVDAKKVMKNLDGIMAILGMFVVLMAATHLAGRYALKGGIAIIAVSLAMLIMVQVIKSIADIDGSIMLQATGSIMGILAVFALVIAASNFAGQYAARAGAMLLLMSGAMLILTASMVIMSKMDPTGLDNAVTAIQRVMVFMSLLIAATSVVPKEIEKTVTTLLVSVGLLAVAIAVLSMVDPSKLQNATTCLSIVMGMFAVIIASTHLMKTSMGTLITMTAVVALLTGAIMLLADIPMEQSLSAAASLSVLMLSFSGALVIAGEAGKIATKSLPGIFAMTGIIAILAGILGLLGSLELGSTLEIAASLSILLLSLSAACAILGPVGASGPLAIKGAGILAAVIGILFAVFAALGGLMVLLGSVVTDGAMEKLDKAIDFLKTVTFGLGEIVGSLFGGLASGAMSGIEGIGTSLSNFMTNLQPFLDGVKGITEESMAGVKMLAETILILTAADLMDRMMSFGSGGDSLAQFAEQLVPFGEAVAKFSETVAGNVNEEAVTAAANAGKILAEMATLLPNTGGVAGFFAGNNDMDTFGIQLVTFGKAIVSFSETVTGKVNEEAVTAAANSGKVLAEMADAIPNTGGVAAFFAGDNDMATFGSQLVAFGRAVVNFSSIVTGKVNEEAVTAAANSGTLLAKMASDIPNSWGLVNLFTGDNDLVTFGMQLQTFGTALVNFSSIVTGKINEEAVTAAANAGNLMVNLANTIPNAGGVVSWFTGDNDLGKFGEQITKFGIGIASFSEAVAGKVDSGNVMSAVEAGKALIGLAETLPEDKLFTNETHLDEFATQISSFGRGIAGFYSSVSGANLDNGSVAISHAKELANFVTEIVDLDTSGIKTYKNAIDELASVDLSGLVEAFSVELPNLSELGSNMIESLTRGFSGKTSDLTNRAKATMDATINVVKGKVSAFSQAGTECMGRFVSGFSKNASKVKSIATNSISSALSGIKSYYMSFYASGTYLGSGFVLGIQAKITSAYWAGYSLGAAAARGVKDGEDSNSPSKEGIKAGIYLGEGLIIGINKMGRSVYSAGYNMGQTASKSLSGAISKITDSINSDMDVQPTIRPVLDLSNIKSGAGAINSMLGGNVLATVGGINTSMNRRIQNGTNGDVVSAIDKLRREVHSLEKPSYSVGGITYDDGSTVASAVAQLIHAVKVERRV